MANTGKIIPFGYTAGGTTELERLMADERAMLVDIRLSPRSRMPAFNQQALQARFRKRYIHMQELGNLNYRPEDRHKGIKIADPKKGIARLVNGLSQGYTLILMCACKNEGCHRWDVLNLLKAAMPEAVFTEGTSHV